MRPTDLCPYPRRRKAGLTICRCNYKGSTLLYFKTLSVRSGRWILNPWPLHESPALNQLNNLSGSLSHVLDKEQKWEVVEIWNVCQPDISWVYIRLTCLYLSLPMWLNKCSGSSATSLSGFWLVTGRYSKIFCTSGSKPMSIIRSAYKHQESKSWPNNGLQCSDIGKNCYKPRQELCKSIDSTPSNDFLWTKRENRLVHSSVNINNRKEADQCKKQNVEGGTVEDTVASPT